MEVNGVKYEIQDMQVIRLVLVDGKVIADFTPSTGIINQHYLDDYPLPQEVIDKLVEE